MPNNTVVVPVSLPKELAKIVNQQAKRQSMTRSEYIRDALRRKTAFAVMDEFRMEASKRVKRAGIRTLQDAVRIVREIRDNKAKV